MLKKIFIIFIALFLIFACLSSYAINMNLQNQEEDFIDENSSIDLSELLAEEEPIENNSNVQTTNTVEPQVTTKSNSSNSLSIETITSIILISIGIVLIFLAIAILIRCK